MLFHVEMTIHIPPEADPEKIASLSAAEMAMARELQRNGTWRHIWRIVGKRANISIFDVESAGDLHDLLTGLPLFPYMEILVRPLCRHPAAVEPSPEAVGGEGRALPA